MSYFDMPGHLIRRLSQHSNHLFQEGMRSEGIEITSVQFAAMQAISNHRQLEQSQIAASIHYDKATIGGVIDRLQKKGWVTRSASPTDGRAKLVALTTDGEQTLQQILPVVRNLQGNILQGLTAKQQQQFLELATRVVSAIDPD